MGVLVVCLIGGLVVRLVGGQILSLVVWLRVWLIVLLIGGANRGLNRRASRSVPDRRLLVCLEGGQTVDSSVPLSVG